MASDSKLRHVKSSNVKYVAAPGEFLKIVGTKKLEVQLFEGRKSQNGTSSSPKGH